MINNFFKPPDVSERFQPGELAEVINLRRMPIVDYAAQGAEIGVEAQYPGITQEQDAPLAEVIPIERGHEIREEREERYARLQRELAVLNPIGEASMKEDSEVARVAELGRVAKREAS